MSAETWILICVVALAVQTSVGCYLGSVKGYAQIGAVLGFLLGPIGWVLVLGGPDLIRRRADAERDRKLDFLLRHHGVIVRDEPVPEPQVPPAVQPDTFLKPLSREGLEEGAPAWVYGIAVTVVVGLVICLVVACIGSAPSP
jgi:hypothetical protein